MKLARKIAAKSAAVVGLGKEAFYRQLEMDVDDAYDYANEIMLKNMMTHDARKASPGSWKSRTGLGGSVIPRSADVLTKSGR